MHIHCAPPIRFGWPGLLLKAATTFVRHSLIWESSTRWTSFESRLVHLNARRLSHVIWQSTYFTRGLYIALGPLWESVRHWGVQKQDSNSSQRLPSRRVIQRDENFLLPFLPNGPMTSDFLSAPLLNNVIAVTLIPFPSPKGIVPWQQHTQQLHFKRPSIQNSWLEKSLLYTSYWIFTGEGRLQNVVGCSRESRFASIYRSCFESLSLLETSFLTLLLAPMYSTTCQLYIQCLYSKVAVVYLDAF